MTQPPEVRLLTEANAATDAANPATPLGAALTATYGTVLVYSGGAYPARPAGAVSVKYIGPVQPTTWLANDEWVDNS